VLVRPSAAGLLLAAATMLAFLARTPLRVVLVDRRRGNRRDRTVLAGRILAAEAAVLVGLATGATLLGDPRWWWAVAAAAPLVALELWFDVRSRSRRLVPELAGAVGVCASAAAVVLAGGGDASLAVAVALIPAARAVTSIPHVRALIARLHHRQGGLRTALAADAAATAIAVGAIAVDPRSALGAAAVGVAIAFQRLGARLPIPPPKIIGLRQMALGFAVVAATAVGVHLI
jgi:hypothetical protein